MKFKNSLGGFNRRIEMTQERASELEYRSTEITKISAIGREGVRKNMSRDAGTCKTTPKYLTFLSSESQKEKRECSAEKLFEERMVECFSNKAKHKLTN